MPRYQYVGEDTRTYPTVPITVTPGDVIDTDQLGLAENPDPARFAELIPPKKTGGKTGSPPAGP